MNAFRPQALKKPLLWVGSIIGVLLLVIAILAIYIGTRSDEWWRDQLTSTLSQALGRTVEIEGAFRLDLGRRITTEVASLRISNPDWTREKDMLRVGSLRLEFDLLSVLGDTFLIHRLELADVKFGLIENQEGQNNWTFATESEPVSEQIPKQVSNKKIAIPVGIEQLALQRVDFSLDQPSRKEPLAIQADVITGSTSPAGEAVLDGKGKLNNIPFSLNVLLEHKETDIQVLPSKVVVGGAEVTAEGRILAREQFRTDLSITGNGPDLSLITHLANTIQLPAWPFQVKGKIEITSSNLKIIGASGTTGKHEIAADGQIPFSALAPLQLDVKGSGPSLHAVLKGLGYDVIPARAAYQVEGKVELANNRLVVNATHARLGPVNATAKLNIPDLNTPTNLIVDVSRFEASNTAAALALVGVKLDLPKTIPANLRGRIKRSKNATGLSKVSGSIGRTRINLDGTIGDPPHYHKTRMVLDISGSNLEDFLAHSVDKAIPFKIKGTVAQNETGTQFENLQLQLANLDAKVHGRVGNWENLKGSELIISAQSPNTDTIAAILNRPVPEGAVKIDGHLRALKNALYIDRMNVHLGRSNLSGDLKLIKGKPPLLKGRVLSTYLDLAMVQKEVKDEQASKMGNNEKLQMQETSDDGDTIQNKTQSLLIPDTPLKLQIFDYIDLDLAVYFDEVTNSLKTLGSLYDLSANVQLKGRDLSVSNFDVRGARGRVSGNLMLTSETDLTRVNVDISGKKILVGLAAAPGQDLDTYPPIDIEAKLNGAGSTYHNLATSLNGRIKAVQGKGTISNNQAVNLFSDTLTELFRTLNPFAKTESTTGLNCSVFLVNFTKGKAEIQDAVVQTNKLTIVSAGIVDLNTEQINIKFQTRPREGLGISASMITNPYIKLGGSLKKPKIELNPQGAAVTTGAAVATGGLWFLYKGVWDRYFSSRDPCGEALKRDAEIQAKKANKP